MVGMVQRKLHSKQQIAILYQYSDAKVLKIIRNVQGFRVIIQKKSPDTFAEATNQIKLSVFLYSEVKSSV